MWGGRTAFTSAWTASVTPGKIKQAARTAARAASADVFAVPGWVTSNPQKNRIDFPKWEMLGFKSTTGNAQSNHPFKVGFPRRDASLFVAGSLLQAVNVGSAHIRKFSSLLVHRWGCVDPQRGCSPRNVRLLRVHVPVQFFLGGFDSKVPTCTDSDRCP